MESESDKRDTERVLILGDLKGEIMVFEPLLIKEISRGGASVETRFPLHLNSLHDLRLTLGAKSVVLKGRVAHSASRTSIRTSSPTGRASSSSTPRIGSSP